MTYAIVPSRTHPDGINLHFDITRLDRLVGSNFPTHELDLRSTVFGKREGTERLIGLVVGRDLISHLFGEKNPLSQLMKEVGFHTAEFFLFAQIEDE